MGKIKLLNVYRINVINSSNLVFLNMLFYSNLMKDIPFIRLYKLYGYLYILRAGIIKLKPGDMIKNISRTSKCRRSGSWNSFKAKNTGNRPADKCQVFRCTEKDTVGSHVKIKGVVKKPYITNLCPLHNSHYNNKWMRVTSGTAVLVRKRDTRGPKQCYKSRN